MIPLRSYGNPPPDEKFSKLDLFEFRLNNVCYLNIKIIVNYFISSINFHQLIQLIIVKYLKFHLVLSVNDMLLLYEINLIKFLFN